MKIIKKGILPDEYVALITCSYCNCRFECTKSEGKYISNTRNESFFQFNCPIVTSKNRSLGSVSVDRVNSKKPYSKDNIVLVHKKINTLKWDLTENEFFKMCKRVSKYNKGKYESYN